jgi:GDPmannose 4,6-dehydratase
LKDGKTVLVVGHKGQDGGILRQQLLSETHTVYGLGKEGLEAPDGSVDPRVSLGNPESLRDAIGRLLPQEIYYLAALHHSSQSLPDGGSIMHGSLLVNAMGLAEMLEAMRLHAPSARLFYAASCLVFGDPAACPQTEETPLAPRSPYAVSKSAGIELCRYFRRTHGIFAACGFLYNHESSARPPNFLSRKTAIAAAAIADGRGQGLVLGQLDSRVDWGYAPEYTEAMRLIMRLPYCADFIVATGHATTVEHFVEAAFSHVKLDWRDHVTLDPNLTRRSPPARPYVGDPRRLNEATGWRARTSAAQVAAIMVDAERRR